jgi:hypothetical protein
MSRLHGLASESVLIDVCNDKDRPTAAHGGFDGGELSRAFQHVQPPLAHEPLDVGLSAFDRTRPMGCLLHAGRPGTPHAR